MAKPRSVVEPFLVTKRNVPPVLMAWVHCRKASGVKPGVKMTQKQKAEARVCVMRELRSSGKSVNPPRILRKGMGKK